MANIGGLVDEGLQCMVCGWGRGGSLYPNYTQSLDGRKEGKVSGKDLPWQRANPRMFAQLGFARPLSVCDAKALSIATLKPHSHTHIDTHANTKQGLAEAYSGHTQSPPALLVLKFCLF